MVKSKINLGHYSDCVGIQWKKNMKIQVNLKFNTNFLCSAYYYNYIGVKIRKFPDSSINTLQQTCPKNTCILIKTSDLKMPSVSSTILAGENVQSQYDQCLTVDPYHLDTYITIDNPSILEDMPVRAWFANALNNFNLYVGQHFKTIEAVSYSAYLYFTAKLGIPLTSSKYNSPIKDSYTEVLTSYCCETCNKEIFTCKKISIDSEFIDESVKNDWVLVYLDDSFHGKGKGSACKPDIEAIISTKKIVPHQLTCYYIFDLMKSIQPQTKKMYSYLIREVILILQDIYFGKAFEESISQLSYVNPDHQISLCGPKEVSQEEVHYIRLRQHLMTKMLHKNVNNLRSQYS